jgi:hypothetical protein
VARRERGGAGGLALGRGSRGGSTLSRKP